MEDPNYEQTDIFAFMMEKPAGKKPKARAKKAAPFAKAAPQPKAAEENVNEPAKRSWREKFWEFDITHPSQDIKDTMKEALLTEGFMKREANKVFKGLFFKEKIFNTKNQALEYLESVPTSYAVKYKIGIEPSPKMRSLAKRLKEKEERLAAYKETQNEKKFAGDFITCPHCHSRVNAGFVKPPLCPVCGDDMRSDTAVKTIRALEETVADLRKRYEDTARKYNSKFTGGEKWIIRLVNPF